MISLPSGTKVWLAAGKTDMRKGFDGLSALVQEKLKADPFSGQLFVFRGRRGDLIKMIWWDGQGMCLFYKRLERDGLSGLLPVKAKCACRRRNCRCCSKALIGAWRVLSFCRNAPRKFK